MERLDSKQNVKINHSEERVSVKYYKVAAKRSETCRVSVMSKSEFRRSSH